MSSTHPRPRAVAITIGGLGAALALVAADRSIVGGPLLVAACLVIAILGVLDLLGAFEPEIEDADRAIPLRALRGPALLSVVAFAAFVLALRAATAGWLGVAGAAVVVPASFLALCACLRELATHLGCEPLSFRRPTPWIVIGATLLYLPLLGATALIDPWETHYGEVAREMIARDDWISPWWAQDRWFWTKPVLDLWLEGLSMRALGVHAHAGDMLVASHGLSPRPEWALRLPSFLFALTGLLGLARGVERAFSARAALLAAVALGTMPQFFLMARQATTDMPLVGSLAAALGLLILAVTARATDRAPSCAIATGSRVLHLSVAQIPLAGAAIVVLAQALTLVSRNLTLHAGALPSLDLHADAFRAGSPGNCGLPGNVACTLEHAMHPGLWPALQAVVWAAALAVVLVHHRRDRSTRAAAYLGAFLLGAVATMAKGPLGVALPACAFLGALAVTGRWKALASAPIVTGTLIVLAATLPWYVATYARHGSPFTDELVWRNMIGRATSHLHDTNRGDDVGARYYVWQAGYALFGWVGLAPMALTSWGATSSDTREPRDPTSRRRSFARVFALLWVVLGFTLFTVMPTKFHHYIFPVLPAVAVALGALLDDLLTGDGQGPGIGASERIALVGGAALVLLVARDLAAPGVLGEARLLNLVTYNYARPWPETLVVAPWLTGAGGIFAVALVASAFERSRRAALAAFLVASIGFAIWGLDDYLVRLSPHWGQRELIETYLRERASSQEPIAAFNMNWKGESFYTGNHVAVFPAGGKIRPWMEAQRAAGARSIFFLTEHGRIQALNDEIGAGVSTAVLTTPGQQNKFALVRATFAPATRAP